MRTVFATVRRVSGIRFGLIPLGQTPQAQLLTRGFLDALSDALGETVEPHHAADYRGLAAALDQGVAHMGWIPPVAAARALRNGTTSASVVAVRNGTTTYSTALIALAKSGIETVADLRGVRAAWVDRESASGYVVIRAHLRAMGVSPPSAFSEDKFCRSHGDVARALAEGTADVGATFFSFQSGTREIARAGWRDGGLADEDVHVVAHAGPIPSDVFVVHQSLPLALRKLAEASMVDARPALAHQLAKDLLHADSFLRATAEHVAMLEDLRAMVETPLASWPPPR